MIEDVIAEVSVNLLVDVIFLASSENNIVKV